LVDRAVVAGRRVTGTGDWPLVAGGLLGLLAMAEVVVRGGRSNAEVSSALLLALCATVPLAFVRTFVLTSALTMTAATMLILGTAHRPVVAGLVALLAALYVLGRRRSRRVWMLVVLPFAVYAVTPWSGDLDGKLLALFVLAATVTEAALGGARRTRGEVARRDASQRAIADTLLEHAARGERARIARELHDVVAHHISMIAVQAETTRLTTAGMPPEGARRLIAIGDTARTALTEMRRLLGVLRDDAGPETATRLPQPGLDQLNDLIDEARDSAGASTRLIVHGRVVPLDPGVQLTAYRIVQEALTNARRHAPGAAVDVRLDYRDDALHLCIRDNGPGPPDPDRNGATGHGLLGMRERAAMVGGALFTGPAPVSGFLVAAVLPTGAR
jgi:signal transduction histidine kinase